MVTTTVCELERAGIDRRPRTILVDAGYWHTRQIAQLQAVRVRVSRHCPLVSEIPRIAT